MTRVRFSPLALIKLTHLSENRGCDPAKEYRILRMVLDRDIGVPSRFIYSDVYKQEVDSSRVRYCAEININKKYVTVRQ